MTILSLFPDIIINNIGLYRDDGLAACKATPRAIENKKKEIRKTFADHKLKITIEANKKVVDFLDVTFNLNNSAYKPYMKAGNAMLYINKNSNHPPTIIKNLPKKQNNRLSSISSNKAEFDKAATPYQNALQASGYEYTLEYEPALTKQDQKKPVLAKKIPHHHETQQLHTK